jgi:chemosensory pili system protein ChpE
MDVLLGVMLGVAYVLPPGPVNIETVRRGLVGGARAALAIQLGAVIGDVVYAILALVGVGLLLSYSAAQSLLALIGTGLLVYLGWSALRSGWGNVDIVACSPAGAASAWPTTPHANLQRTFLTGLAISIANPYGIPFWLSVGSSFMQHSHNHGVLFLCGFFLGSLLSSLMIAGLVGRCCSRISPQILRWTSGACGLALIALGLCLGRSMFSAW